MLTRPTQLATRALLRTAVRARSAAVSGRKTRSGSMVRRLQPLTLMSILLFLLFGIVAGFLARALMPGRQSMGMVMTGLLGIAGSFVGGFVGSLFTGASVLELNTSGIIGSVLGALAVLAVVGFAGRGRGRAHA